MESVQDGCGVEAFEGEPETVFATSEHQSSREIGGFKVPEKKVASARPKAAPVRTKASAKVKAVPAKKAAPATRAKTAAQKKSDAKISKGAAYACHVCGLVVTVDRVCGCVDTCDIICCGESMQAR